MAFTAGAAWAHLDSLAAEHMVTVKPCKIRADGSEANIAARVVWVAKDLTPVGYLAALHEFGHIVSDSSRRAHYEYVHGGRSPLVKDATLACEAAAWGWAVEHRDRDLVPKLGKKLLAKVLKMFGSHLADDD